MSALTPKEQGERDAVAFKFFTSAMEQKMIRKGIEFADKDLPHWTELEPAEVSRMLREHVEKGDPRDVAILAMFLFNKGAKIEPLPECSVPLNRRGALAFTLSQCLRNAFFAGAGVADGEKISAEQQEAWIKYEPPSSYTKLVGAILQGSACQHALQIVRDHLLRMGWKPDSIMIEGIDKALEPVD